VGVRAPSCANTSSGRVPRPPQGSGRGAADKMSAARPRHSVATPAAMAPLGWGGARTTRWCLGVLWRRFSSKRLPNDGGWGVRLVRPSCVEWPQGEAPSCWPIGTTVDGSID